MRAFAGARRARWRTSLAYVCGPAEGPRVCARIPPDRHADRACAHVVRLWSLTHSIVLSTEKTLAFSRFPVWACVGGGTMARGSSDRSG